MLILINHSAGIREGHTYRHRRSCAGVVVHRTGGGVDAVPCVADSVSSFPD